MDINLNKKQEDINYYYSLNGEQFGPFDLTNLISKIDENTLVWKEGIEWTNANKLDELKIFFPEEITKTEKSNNLSSSQIGFTQVKQNMFSAPFSFDGRIRRTEYGLSFIIYAVCYVITIGIIESSPVFGLVYIPLIWFLWAQGAKRCHDRNNSGWYQIIPFYALWMLFAEGDISENEYGNNPK